VSEKDDGGPVFPCGVPQKPRYPGHLPQLIPSTGMSLRHWFAGQALAGLCGQIDMWNASKRDIDLVAAQSFEIADAMLADRAGTEA
jgi:hypothetical protein